MVRNIRDDEGTPMCVPNDVYLVILVSRTDWQLRIIELGPSVTYDLFKIEDLGGFGGPPLKRFRPLL